MDLKTDHCKMRVRVKSFLFFKKKKRFLFFFFLPFYLLLLTGWSCLAPLESLTREQSSSIYFVLKIHSSRQLAIMYNYEGYRKQAVALGKSACLVYIKPVFISLMFLFVHVRTVIGV